MDYIKKYSDIEVERGVMPESLGVNMEEVESQDAYPVTVTLRHLPRPDSVPETATDAQTSSVPNGMHRSNMTADTTEASLQQAQASEGTRAETIKAKYVVGCDGAHSWTRRQIGSVMEGEQTEYIWFVNHLNGEIGPSC